MPALVRSLPVQLAVAAVVVPLGLFSRLPTTPAADTDALAQRFAFHALTIPPPPSEGEVDFAINPSATHLETYLHSIGSGLALGDIDGDGLSNDLCLSDIRNKAMVIEPVPGTGERYAPFELNLELPPGRTTSWPGACRLVDLNEDGLTDVIVSSMTAPPVVYLRSDNGEPPRADNFIRRELLEVSGRERAMYVPTINVVDIDGDGHQDLVFGAYLPDGIQFYDPEAREPIVLQDSFSRARNGGRNRVLLWTGATSGDAPTVSYREARDPFPGDSALAWTLAIGSGDLDGDGLSDLYIANDFGPDTMLLNRSTPGRVDLREVTGRRSWTRPLSKSIGHDSFKGMGVDLADVNGDGRLDLYVSNIGTPFALNEGHFLWISTGESFENNLAPYEDQAEALGVNNSAWSWDSRMDDFDNDGIYELVQATGFFKGTVDKWADFSQLGLTNDALISDPSVWPEIGPNTDIDGSEPQPFFVLGPGGRYVDLSRTLFDGFLANARSISTADVDGDGDLDLAFGNHWEDSVFFRNDSEAGRSIGLHVLIALDDRQGYTHEGHPLYREGTPALGAAVTIARADGVRLLRQVDASNGHTGARAPELLFGLGDATALVRAEIRWRDRTGALREQVTELTPGWHTVVLGALDASASGAAGGTR